MPDITNLSELETSVALWLAPPVALIIAAALAAYIWRLTENIAAGRTFRSRGFKLFDTVLLNGKEAVIVGQDLWSTYFEIRECPRHTYEVIPNTRLAFQSIAKVPRRLTGEQ